MNRILFCFCVLIVLLFGCKSIKETQRDVELFQSKLDSTSKIVYKDLKIKPLDHLRIQVLTESTTNQEQVALFNLPGNGLQSLSGSSMAISGSIYDVDKDGYIEFPKLGKINILGLTAIQLRDTLTKLVTPYVNEPRIIVNMINVPVYSFGQLGDSKIIFPDEKITLIDFLSRTNVVNAAGARLDNILVVREDSGLHKYYEVDVRSPKTLYNSPVFQLEQNDVVYVHPTKSKLRQLRNSENSIAASNFSFYTSLVTTSLSLYLFFVSFKNIVK